MKASPLATPLLAGLLAVMPGGTVGAAQPAGGAAPGAIAATVISALPEGHAALQVFRERFRHALDARLAAAGTGASIAWRPAHDRAIAHADGVFEAVEDALGAFGIVEVGEEAARLPLQSLTAHTPFASDDCAAVAGAYHGMHTGIEGVREAFAAGRQRYLAPIASDPVALIGTVGIDGADEMRGTTVGMPGRLEPWIAGVEGNPVRLPEEMLALRLDEGAIAAVLMPTSDIGRLRLPQIAGYYTDTGMGARVALVLTVAAGWYEALPEAVRAAVDATAEAFVGEGAAAYCAIGAEARAKIEARGLRTAAMIKSRRTLWASALPPLAWEWAEARDREGLPGTAALGVFMERLRAAGARPVRDWDSPSVRVTAAGE